MRILLVHSYYQLRGGEDAVFEAERDLLMSRGHEVRTYIVHNELMSGLNPLGAAARTIWSSEDHARLGALLADWRPDVMHVHNTFQAMSPSVLWAASRAAVPVVQTLHNFRLICPQAMLLRHERICED
ncbi:MAG: glycosyltransferase [Aquabacterium sp.]